MRVEKWISTHPACKTHEISAALDLAPSTLHGYTQDLRRLGRLVKTAHPRTGIHGMVPDVYHVVPGLQPLDISMPLTAPKKLTRWPAPARMEIVAALFGPAGRVHMAYAER